MTHLQSITIQNFRNLENVALETNSQCNILFGLNGSGKTSFLEAIYYLGLGRSFRTRHSNRLIQYDQPNFTLHATIKQQYDIPVGVIRHATGASHIKINHTPVASIADVAQLLPIQLIYPDGHKLLLGGSKPRRQFLDWGVFHVEHPFLNNWQRAQRAIRHRNVLLKQRTNQSDSLDAWDQELINISKPIDEARKAYIADLIPIFHSTLESLQLKMEVKLAYYRGWNHDKEYSQVLIDQKERDALLGYTHSGPHKADILLTHLNRPLSETLSQGQQKLVNYALKLAQGEHLIEQTNKRPIYLIDDLPAELDVTKRALLSKLLSDLDAQIFITGIDREALPSIDGSMFHVEQSTIIDLGNTAATNTR